MCKIYNRVGSESTLLSCLTASRVHDFHSLDDVVSFQKNYWNHLHQINLYHENLLEQEKNSIWADLVHLEATISMQEKQAEQKLNTNIEKLKSKLDGTMNTVPANMLLELRNKFWRWYYQMRIRRNERRFDSRVKKSTRKLTALHQSRKKRFQYITENFSQIARQEAEFPLSELERRKSTIEMFATLVHGALGEQKVVKALEVLSDEYYLINDFSISFSNPIRYKQDKDFIKSIQIDHILIGPSGVFLIETKNWSEDSLENLNLRSPVEQVHRSSYALYALLNNRVGNYRLRLDKHHWGEKKMSIRNLLVFIGNKPKEEFQYLKILTLQELIGYVSYFNPVYSNMETVNISDFLLSLNARKRI